jgi:L-asparaginase / beta-aspartyl-peptidase
MYYIHGLYSSRYIYKKRIVASYMIREFGILLHGGAKTKKISVTSNKGEKIIKNIGRASQAGFSLLKRGNSAVDAVEASVIMMEDSGVFNAGAGSCLTIDRSIEMDASIMSGRDLSAGCVGMVHDIANPIKLARRVMETSGHVMLVSSGALKFARLANIPLKKNQPDKKSLDRYRKLMSDLRKSRKKNSIKHPDARQHQSGTVGAVAVDIDRNVASAVSTGGRWLKMSGRIGDSGIIGGGFYADNKLGAACATGNGEFIMRLCLSKYACDRMKARDAIYSSREAIGELTRIFGANTGGIIAVDPHGEFGISHNTPSMPISWISSKDQKLMTFLSVN